MKVTYHIPSYEEALDIVQKAGEMAFYETVYNLDGFKISIFNYRLAKYNDFINYKAQELRGLTFVFNQDGSLFKRFILLHKFYNLNQVEETQYNLLKDIPISEVMNKEDGSIISFIQLPNGKICAKSKEGIDNTQSEMAQKIYDNDITIKNFVEYSLSNNLVPIFELVSPFNRVVLPYTETELILTRLRDNNTGEYVSLSSVKNILYGIKTAPFESFKNLSEMIELSETIEDKEGWVVQLVNGLLLKIKTKYYCDLHHLFTEVIHREDYLIDIVLDEKIDDLLGQLSSDDIEVRELIDVITEKVYQFLKIKNEIISRKVDEFKSVFNSDKKSFVLANRKDKDFHFYMEVINYNSEPYDIVKKYLKRKTYFLADAKEFVRNGTI